MWIEIFRTGTHTDSSGNTSDYNEESLDTMAELYNSKINESQSYQAPVVKGHPETDSPAYGWVKRLARRGSRLLAKLTELDNSFINEVREGRFRKISVALLPDLMLKHVGFLGAASPAVEGMEAVKFDQPNHEGDFHFESSFIETTVDDLSDESISNVDIENNNESKFIDANSRINQLEDINKQLQLENENLKTEKRQNEIRQFVNGLIEKTKGMILTPAMADDAFAILEMAYKADENDCADNIENPTKLFSDNKIANVEKVKHFLSSIESFDISQEFAKKSDFNKKTSHREFSGLNVAPDRLNLHLKALEIINTNPDYNYEQALAEAEKFWK